MNQRKHQPSRDKKWVDKLADIANAIRDSTAKDDPTAKSALAQSKIGNTIQVFTLIVAVLGGMFAYLAYKETRRQADTAQDQLVQSTRAWIYVDFALNRELANVKAGEEAPVLNMPLSNTGSSPALKVRQLLLVQYLTAPPTEPKWEDVEAGQNFMDGFVAQFYKRDASTFTTVFTVFPGSRQYFYSVPLGMAPNWEAEYVANKRILYAWTRIDYCDIFGRPHWTKACVAHAYSKIEHLGRFTYCKGGGIVTDTENDQLTYACG